MAFNPVVLAPARPHADALARLPRGIAFRLDALPIEITAGVLLIGVPDLRDTAILDSLRAATRMRIRPVEMPRDLIRESLVHAYGDAVSASERDAAPPAVRAVDATLTHAIGAHASDVHIEPNGEGGRIRLRVDGLLHEGEQISPTVFPAYVSRLKLLAGMDIADRRTPQDGRYSVPIDGRGIDLRVSSVPTADGEKLVVRILDHHASTPDLTQLGMAPALYGRYRQAIVAPWGFILVTGPTGSGKTTTLYASLGQLDCAARNICAVEDPVEMRMPGITQVQVNARAGLTFPNILRSFLRQDPNVMMVGEMRDAETASVAVAAALSGQTVFTTLHANDAPRTIDRLIELGVARRSLAAALSAVLAQRLVRKLCERCRRREPIPTALRAALGVEQDFWFVPGSCGACTGTGYVGRTGIYELLLVNDTVRDAIASGASSVQIAADAVHAGYAPMFDDALAKVLAGETTFAELRRVVAWTPTR